MSIKAEALINTERNRDAESREKSVAANMSSRHLWKADLYDECSLNTSRPCSNSKSHLPRQQENLGSRNRFSAAEPEVQSQARESIRSLIVNSSAHNQEKCVCSISLSQNVSFASYFSHTPALACSQENVNVSGKNLQPLLNNMCNPFLPAPRVFFHPATPPHTWTLIFFHLQTPSLALPLLHPVRHIPTVSLSPSLSHTYVLLGREQIGKHKLDMEAGRYKHSHSLDSVLEEFLTTL